EPAEYPPPTDWADQPRADSRSTAAALVHFRAEMGQIVREVDQVLIGEVRQLLRQRATIAEAGPTLVLAHGLEQVVLALVGEARHLLAPGEIRIVADAA